MERALNLEAIQAALGEGPSLPSPEELQEKLVEAEMELFFGQGTIDEDLLTAGWYLHSVGSAPQSEELYTIERQRQAHRIAAHIFDLAGQIKDLPYIPSLEIAFAGQISYLRGGLAPNAMALFRRGDVRSSLIGRPPGAVALELGVSLLGLDTSILFRGIRDRLFPQLRGLRHRLATEDLITTPYGAVDRVVRGVWNLIIYLTYGPEDQLHSARELFREAVGAPGASGDLDSRWVAAHLLDISDGLTTSSVWSLLPDDTPPGVGTSMTLGEPPVLQMWPPQIELFNEAPNPLDAAVRRLILSLPTSAGKTLTAQLIVAAHLARGGGSVCVVVPTHSLAREVRRDLNRRLRLLRKAVLEVEGFGVFVDVDGPQAFVMTPEALAAQLRNDPARVLGEYSMFIFDEAHLVADRERGWVLESVLSFLHEQTIDTEHRILLLSAALGNQIHYAAWMGDERAVVHKDWRGPRRAHAVWTTIPDPQTPWTYREPRTRRELRRRSKPRLGQIWIRTGPGQPHVRTTIEPVGQQVEVWRGQRWTRDGSNSSRFYRMRVIVAQHLGGHGPVLVIEGTKQDCQRFAEALADELEDDPATQPLVNFATSRLEEHHPLVQVLRKGVGFHHAALPEDVQAELEDAVRRGNLHYLVSTTTLIEGINLPVRSVLIGSRGYRDRDGFVETLDPARMLNAVGRAGRATKETEGWVVLNEDYRFRTELFDELTAEAHDIQVESRLIGESALDALALFEEVVRSGEDAVFSYTGPETADFVSHVWFVASALEELHGAMEQAPDSFEHTLAWQQMDDETRQRWMEVARRAADAYQAQPEGRRKRWARSGTSVTTAVELDSIARQVADDLQTTGSIEDPIEAFDTVAASGRLQQLLELPELSARAFKETRRSPRDQVLDVDYASIVGEWIGGRPLVQIGEDHLTDVEDEDYRHEQLSEFAANVLEHFLPWTLQTIVSWVNDITDSDPTLCVDLPAHVRYGTPSAVGLALMRGGVRSRRLVQAVIQEYEASGTEADVRGWLANGDLAGWRDQFRASPNELGDLLNFVRDRDSYLVARVLSGETIDLKTPFHADPGDGYLSHADETQPSRIGVWRNESLLGYVPSKYHDDLDRLLAAGIPLDVQIAEVDGETVLRVRAIAPDTDPGWFADT